MRLLRLVPLLAVFLVLPVFAVHLPGSSSSHVAIASGYSPQTLSFSLRLREDLIVPHRVFAVFLMPGERLDLEVSRARDGEYRVHDQAARISGTGRHRWLLHAPEEPGLYPLHVERSDTGERMQLNLFVLTPREQKQAGELNGYRVGNYPSEPFRGLSEYEPPPGFVEMDEDMAAVHVAPHFKLGQFASKQSDDYPKFLILDERLLLLLEEILEAVNAEGIEAGTLQVLSGFRTPWYNAAIGNGENSRHQWGAAADIYIDERAPAGRMDDLTGDGRSDFRDAERLAEIVERVKNRSGPMSYIGGIGLYGPRPHRGPFVHVDVRGYEARWAFK
ncbi:D-Ala-D-Ala carboxypeptidase family metallohydrolase [Methylonatrum kenyense]|uniref:D-Ala-D-Ala carboxypeptidase family metallohydrolase n=1 Tax=Methylonatrum kenyense TaxID=455253 RepID=UPI0020C15925|nr:D-Ala-D-Ala carboxypeptidase family metallohydrolase [Methylonatrum kenyense]MCK8515541.1 D-Ala-D-Ala carboxypeptidase family metallohydrolase [Methylonatrum kenyense]